MQIKGLYEALGISKAEIDELRSQQVALATQRIMFYSRIVALGGNIHRYNSADTTTRRARNKVARKQRRVNRLRG